MKILILTPALLSGGTERYIINFAKVYSSSCDIDISYYRNSNEETIGELKKYVRDIIKLPYYVKKPLGFINRVRALYQNGNYDYVYVHANHALSIIYTFPLWVKKNSGTKILFHSHNSDGENALLQSIFRKIINKVCYKKYACSVSASEFMYGSDDAYIIKNGVDLELYNLEKNVIDEFKQKYSLEDAFVIGHVGRFSKQKNHQLLIDIFGCVATRQANSKLVLIGEGELQGEIKEKIHSLNLDDKVIIINRTNQVNVFYQLFDAFVLPSLYEGLPFAGIEAQAAGLPCYFSDVITDAIAITPLVHFLSLDDSPEKWADAILAKHDGAGENYQQILRDKGYSIYSMREDYSKSGIELGDNRC